MKGISINHIKPLVMPIMAILLYFCFQQKMEDWLWVFISEWFSGSNELVGGAIITLLAGLLSWYLWENCKQMKLSLNHAGWILFILILYLYHRCGDSYYFWSFTIYGIDIAFTDLFVFPLILLLGIQCVTYNNGHKEEGGLCLLDKDEPITDVETDVLGYNKTIVSLMKDLQLLKLEDSSFSVGIAGEWGLGKSSFFNLFKKKLKEEFGKKIIIVEFNPRSSTDVKDIQKDFFDTFASELAPYYSGIVRDMNRYQDALQLPEDNFVLKLLRLLPSLTVANSKKAINGVIDNLHRRIFVFIDDFDRLTAQEILEMMKVIDRNGDFHQTVYITAYDKEYVNSVLRKHLGYNRKHVFTDKYFSYELHLPPQSNDALKDYVKNSLNTKLKSDSGDAITVKQMLEQWDVIGDSVVGYLHTLRHVKRFMNIFLSRYNNVRNDVDLGDFLRVTLLRYFDIGIYHALVEGKLTKDGGLFSGNTDQVVYQNDEMEDLLKRYSKWEGSKTILNELLSKSTANDFELSTRYKRMQFKGAFACYFYDYLPDGLYYKDLMQLYDAKTDKEAFEILHKLIKHDRNKYTYDQGRYVAVENFLRFRPLSELRWSGDVIRLFLLLCHLNSMFARPINIESSISYFFSKKAAEELDDTMEGDYKGKLSETIRTVIGEQPLSIAFVIGTINLDLLSPDVNEGDFAFTRTEILEFAELCQRCYFNLIGTINPGNFDAVMNLSKVMVAENGKQRVSDSAKGLFCSFISQHPEDFVKNAISVVRPHTGNPVLTITHRKTFVPESFFPYKGIELTEWVRREVNDYYSALLFTRLLKEQDRVLTVKLNPSQYNIDEKDFAKVYEVVKLHDEVVQEKCVLDAMKLNVANSIKKIAQQTSIEVDGIKATLLRLSEKGEITEEQANMAEEIPNFKQKDFVWAKSAVKVDGDNLPKEKGDVYRIQTIRGKKITLVGVTGETNIDEIEAVPIDGVHDRNIYYAPVVAADGMASSPSEDTYYLLSFENTEDENGKKYSEIVKHRNYHFVHEIQHWLHDEQDFGLNINRLHK